MKNIYFVLFILISLSPLQAFSRRTQQSASWENAGGIETLPSLQSHLGPLIFSTFTAEDLTQPQVISEIEQRVVADSLLAHQKSRIRGEIYRDFITTRLHEYRVPGELISIVYIESSFSIRAKSRTGAMGLWQFADNSMAPWMRASTTAPAWDERLDFWKATDAAIEKLLQNYEKTGTWLLAVGAYNGGLGRMSRALASGKSNFWELERGEQNNQISNETAQYVPRFIAASILSLYPGRFGINLDWSDSYEWRRIPYMGSLKEFSEKTKVPLTTLHAGNAEYLDGFVPSGNHYVKFPARYERAVHANIQVDNLPSQFYFVQAGDTFWNISRRYDVTVEQLRDLNNMRPNDILKVGMRLIIGKDVADNK